MVKTKTFNHLALNDLEPEILRIALIEVFERLEQIEKVLHFKD